MMFELCLAGGGQLFLHLFIVVFLNMQISFLNKFELFQRKILHSGRHLHLYLPLFTGETGSSTCRCSQVRHAPLPAAVHR